MFLERERNDNGFLLTRNSAAGSPSEPNSNGQANYFLFYGSIIFCFLLLMWTVADKDRGQGETGEKGRRKSLRLLMEAHFGEVAQRPLGLEH